MRWFKVYHGISTDPTLRAIAAELHLPLPFVVGCWIAVLEYVSRNSDRGSLAGLDAPFFARIAGVKRRPELILAAFERHGLVGAGRVAEWERYQGGARRSRKGDAKRASESGRDNDLRDPLGAHREPNGRPLGAHREPTGRPVGTASPWENAIFAPKMRP